MANNNTYSVPYRRKREGKTNYKKRMKLLLGNTPRLVIRRSLKHITIELVQFQPTGDKIIASAHSRELTKHGWKASTSNTSAAYLTGLLIAKKTKKQPCVLDIGMHTSVKGCTLYAAAKGAKDGGLELACAKEVIPEDSRIRGEHIAIYAKKIKTDKKKYEKQFSSYIRNKFDPEQLPIHFDQIKTKIGER